MTETAAVLACPECGSERAFRNGGRRRPDGNRIQRFICRKCSHRFSERPIPTKPADDKTTGSQVCVIQQEAKNLEPTTAINAVGDERQKSTKEDPRITQFAWKCKLKNLKPNTIERRRYILQRLVNDGADLNDPATVETILALNNYPTPTKWLAVQIYRRYCKAYHIEWEDPPRVKYQPKKPYIPSRQDCTAFLAAMPKKLMIFCRVLFETGCRSGEAVQIEWQDVNMDTLTIHIAHPEKGSNERTIKVSRELCQMIDSMPRKYGAHVFNPKLRTWDSTFNGQRRKIVAKFGKPEWLKLHFHSFRHIRATYDIRDGIDPYEVKDKLGHKCISNTDKYVHWVKEENPEVNDKYYTQTTATDLEAQRLEEAGWQFIYVNPNTQRAHWKKPK